MSEKRNADGVPVMASNPRVGNEVVYVTHNFSDPTTWFTESLRVTDEVAADSGDGLTFDLAKQNVIDMTHGKVFDEDDLAADEGTHLYAVAVTVDDAAKTQRTPFAVSGGDYTVDYAAGTITFAASQAGKTVKVSYSHENGSCFLLAPAAGKALDIEKAEVQFSKDVVLNSTIEFEIWAYNPYDLPNKVMVAKTSYKTMRNIIEEAMGSFPVIPAIGGAARGTAQDTYGFPFRYGTVRRLKSSQGIELRVKLSGDTPFGGEYATATWYCTSHDEAP